MNHELIANIRVRAIENRDVSPGWLMLASKSDADLESIVRFFNVSTCSDARILAVEIARWYDMQWNQYLSQNQP